MKVNNHRLIKDDGSQVAYTQSPNMGSTISPIYLVVHYTAGRSFSSSVDWLTNPIAKASAHLVIGRAGEIEQLVPFNRKAWHAGRSQWGELVGLNSYSIGIELDNAGRLTRTQSGDWSAWFGGAYTDSEVAELVHKHEHELSGWHTYTQEQMDALIAVSLALQEKYGFADILGHDDIAPNRKADPGPAFPMMSFRSHILGRGS